MSTSSPPPPPRKRSALTRVKRAFWVLVIGSLVLFAGYTWVMLRFSYSGLPGSCFGETRHIVDGVKAIATP